MKRWSTFALSAVGLGAVATAAGFATAACGWKDEAVEGPAVGNDAGTSGGSEGGVVYSGKAGAACAANPSQVPNPECDNGDETQCTGTTTCDLASCQALNTTAAGCEAFTNNPTGGPFDFRMRRIILVAPPNLTTEAAQNTVVNSGVDINEPQCGAPAGGAETGDFSWILSMDTTAMTVTTGGAPPCDISNPTKVTPFPSCNPFTTGYCFVHKTLGSLPIGPITAPMTKAGDGTYGAAIGTINIPIYFNGGIIVLPINGGEMNGVKLSTDGNCIGSFNPQALQADCSNDYTACSLWKTDGSITGYITLEQADSVTVSLLNATLCAFLTGTPPKTQGALAVCPRDGSGNITAAGDYCSTTKSAAADGGTCHDAFWLAATFTASAVKINDGAGVPDCLGTIDEDAGGTPGGNDAGDAAAD
jgi:hypothetical protein